MNATRDSATGGDAVSVPRQKREANSFPYRPGAAISDAARRRMLADRFEPLFYANWDNAVFIHYEANPAGLQRCIPFALDLYEGRAFVSIVAFTLHRMRPRIGGKFSEWLFKPIATHPFFNVRTYVRHHGEPAIFFMAEWLSNRLSVAIGPSTFGLPYRYGEIEYHNDGETGRVSGRVVGPGRETKERRFSNRRTTASRRFQTAAPWPSFEYRATVSKRLTTCDPGSLDEFLLERYTAFTAARWRKQFFRVWHEPWPQTQIEIAVTKDDLLAVTGDWWPSARLLAANYSPGVNVWMGWPHLVEA